MNLSRRRLFGFGAALVAAPAIVRVSALMPISVPRRRSFTADELGFISDAMLSHFLDAGSAFRDDFGLAALIKDNAAVELKITGIDRSGPLQYAWKPLHGVVAT